MSAGWEPGDVAILDYSRGSFVSVFTAAGHWRTQEDTTAMGELARGIRPLVVIDPEDREQVERLLASYHGWKWTLPIAEASIADMQAALREFANPTPPRMDEPGTWGVVEASCVHSDTRCEWVRYPSGNWHTLHHSIGDLRNPDDWDSLVNPALVREGVTA